MGWASRYIEKLLAGETVQFRPHGNSMSGKVENGELVTVEPVSDSRMLAVGDIVLCKVHGREFLHLVKGIRRGSTTLFQIGNNRGHINGWTSNIFGKCTKVEP